MRSKKKLALLLSTILCALFLVMGLAACNNGASAKDAIDLYILPQNETLVSEDFTLPKKIGKNDSVSVKWTSGNTNAIAIEDNGENYKAKVTLQDEVTPVTLTISAGSASKDFTVRVDGLSVYTFLDNYVFKQKNTAVKEDFDLDLSTTYQGKTATITWNIAEKYQAYATLNEAKNRVIVSEVEEITQVQIEATFDYNGDTAKQQYTFSVAPPLDHRQTVNYYYSIEGYPLELSGYIVHLVEASESYGNATFYMIDDEFYSGYYCFRVKIDKTEVDKYVDGAHVTVTGDTTKNYNGLWENNSGGTATVDDKDPIDPKDYIYAYDTDLLSGVPSGLWRESTLVSLSGWRVSAVYTKPATWVTGTSSGTNTNIATLTRGDTSIVVRLSKYMGRTQEQLEAFGELFDTLKVGDIVDVVGILGNYEGFQIQPILASDVTKVDEEGTNTDGAAVKAAVDKVKEEADKNFSALITTDGTFTMPTSESGVTISYRVAGAGKDPTVVIDGGTFTVKPVETEKNYDIEVTYKIGDYEAYGFFKIRNWKQSADKLVLVVKDSIEKSSVEVKAAGDTALPEVDSFGATITWTVKSGTPEWASIVGNTKLHITALPDEAKKITLVADIELDGEAATAELEVDIPAASVFVHEGTIEDPYTVEEAIKIANSLEADATYSNEGTPVQVAIAGYVTDVGKIYSQGDTDYMSSVYIADVAGGKTTLQLYTTAYGDAVDKPATKPTDTPFTVGDYIVIYGFIKNFKGNTPEVDKATVNDEAVYPTIKTWEKVSVKGSHANPYTVAELKELSIATDATGTAYYMVDGIVTPVYVKGIITTAGSVQSYGIKQYYIADAAGDTKNQIQLYSINWDYVKKDTAISVGDTVLVYGYPQKYKGGDVQVSSWKETVDGKDTYHNALLKELIPAAGTTDPDPTPDPEPDPEIKLDHAGTAEDPYSVKDALAATNALESDGYSTDVVYVTGYVASIKNKPSTQYPNWNQVVIVDEKGGDAKNGFTIYKIYPNEDTALKLWEDLSVGSKITVKGYLQNYKGNTPEMSDKGNTKIETVSYEDARTDAEKANAAIAAAKQSLESTYKDGVGSVLPEITLPASAVTGVTLKYTASVGTIADGKLPITHGAEETTITIDIEAEDGTKVTVSLKIAAGVVIEDGDYEYDFKGIGNDTVALSTADLLSLLNGLTDVDIIVSVDEAASVYKGQGSGGAHENSPDMLKVGKASSGTEIHLTFAKAVTKIVIDCESWKGKTSRVSVNGGTVQTTTKDTRATLTFEFEATTSVTIKVETSAILIYKLTVTVGSASATVSAPAEVAILPGKQF